MSALLAKMAEAEEKIDNLETRKQQIEKQLFEEKGFLTDLETIESAAQCFVKNGRFALEAESLSEFDLKRELLEERVEEIQAENGTTKDPVPAAPSAEVPA